MNNGSVVVQPGTGKVYITPVAFLQYSRDFYNASCAYNSEANYSPASNYLVCRALELALKSFLLTKEIEVKFIKFKLGHDLEKLLQKSDEVNIASLFKITKEERIQIAIANAWYGKKGFEYFDLENLMVGWETLPDLEILSELNKRLIDFLRPLCMEASRN